MGRRITKKCLNFCRVIISRRSSSGKLVISNGIRELNRKHNAYLLENLVDVEATPDSGAALDNAGQWVVTCLLRRPYYLYPDVHATDKLRSKPPKTPSHGQHIHQRKRPECRSTTPATVYPARTEPRTNGRPAQHYSSLTTAGAHSEAGCPGLYRLS